jgi:hypothetical protein
MAATSWVSSWFCHEMQKKRIIHPVYTGNHWLRVAAYSLPAAFGLHNSAQSFAMIALTSFCWNIDLESVSKHTKFLRVLDALLIAGYIFHKHPVKAIPDGPRILAHLATGQLEKAKAIFNKMVQQTPGVEPPRNNASFLNETSRDETSFLNGTSRNETSFLNETSFRNQTPIYAPNISFHQSPEGLLIITPNTTHNDTEIILDTHVARESGTSGWTWDIFSSLVDALRPVGDAFNPLVDVLNARTREWVVPKVIKTNASVVPDESESPPLPQTPVPTLLISHSQEVEQPQVEYEEEFIEL